MPGLSRRQEAAAQRAADVALENDIETLAQHFIADATRKLEHPGDAQQGDEQEPGENDEQLHHDREHGHRLHGHHHNRSSRHPHHNHHNDDKKKEHGAHNTKELTDLLGQKEIKKVVQHAPLLTFRQKATVNTSRTIMNDTSQENEKKRYDLIPLRKNLNVYCRERHSANAQRARNIRRTAFSY